MSNENLETRIEEVRGEASEADARQWVALDDERISRIAGDENNERQTMSVSAAVVQLHAELSAERETRSVDDLGLQTKLTKLSQALSDYSIKSDLALNQESIARRQLGVDLNSRIDNTESTFSHEKYLVYQAIQGVLDTHKADHTDLNDRVKKYEEMLQNITMDSIQITMDNGEINMGAWTILSQAREWDLELLNQLKGMGEGLGTDLKEAMDNLQSQIPTEKEVIELLLENLADHPLIKEMDEQLTTNHQLIMDQQKALADEAQQRIDSIIAATNNIRADVESRAAVLLETVEGETQARIDALNRESEIRTAEIDARIGQVNDYIAVIEDQVDGYTEETNQTIKDMVEAADEVREGLATERAERLVDIASLDNGLTVEIKNRKDGDTAILGEITTYKNSNEQSLAAIRTSISTVTDKASANATKIDSLDVRTKANEGEIGSVRDVAASALSKASSAVDATSALSIKLDELTATITDLEEGAETVVDVNAFNVLKAQVTNQGGSINTLVSDMSSVKSDLSVAKSGISGNTQAISNLSTSQVQQGNSITQLVSDTTALKNDLAVTNRNLDTKVSNTSFSGLESRVTANEGSIESVTSDVTLLQNEIINVNKGLASKASNEALNTTNAKVTTIDGKVSANIDSINSLKSRATDLETKANTTADALSNMYTKAQANEATAGQINQYKATLSGNGTNLITQEGTLTYKLMPSTNRVTSGNGLTFINNAKGSYPAVQAKATSNSNNCFFSSIKGENILKVEAGKRYIFSVYAKPGQEGKKGHITIMSSTAETMIPYTVRFEKDFGILPVGEWTRMSLAYTPTRTDEIYLSPYLYNNKESAAASDTNFIWFTQLMIEEAIGTGDVASPWVDGIVSAAINNKAEASALTATDAKVTKIEGNITTVSSNIVALNNRLDTQQGQINSKANSSAVTNLESKVTQLEGGIASTGSDVTLLRNELTTTKSALEGEINKANAGYLPSKPDTSKSGQWLRRTYDKTQPYMAIGVVPDYSYLSTFTLRSEAYEKDGSILWKSSDKNLNCVIYLRTIVTVDAAKTIQFTSFRGDDAHAVYVNGTLVYSFNANKTQPISFDLTAGTHIIDLICNDGTGDGGFVMSPTLGSQVTTMYAPVSDALVIETKASTESLSALDSKVTVIDGKTTSLTQQTTDLKSAIEATNKDVATKATTQALNNLAGTVTEQGGKITANTNSLTNLNSKIDSGLSGKLDASVINNYFTKAQTTAEAERVSSGQLTEFNASLQIGGSNLALASDVPTVSIEDSGANKRNNFYFLSKPFDVIYKEAVESYGSNITVSFDWEWVGTADQVPAGKARFQIEGGKYSAMSGYIEPAADKKSGHMVFTLPVQENWLEYPGLNKFGARRDNFIGKLKVSNMKVEYGSKATAWSPADADITLALEANSTAINATNTEVSRINGVVTSEATKLSKLESTVGGHTTSIASVTQIANTAASTNATQAVQLTKLEAANADKEGKLATITQTLNTLSNNAGTTASNVQQLQTSLGRRKVYKVTSMGWNTPNFTNSDIKNEDGSVAYKGARSWNVVTFNSDNSINVAARYDVYVGGATVDAFNARIEGLALGEYCLVFTSDAGDTNRSLIKEALTTIGGTATTVQSMGSKYSYILVGRKGLPEGQGIELLSRDGSTPIEYILELINGAPLGLSGAPNNANVIKALESSISTVEGKVTSTAGDLTNLTTKVNGNEANLINNYATKSELNNSQASSVLSLKTTLGYRELPTEKDDTKPNSWFYRTYIPSGSGTAQGVDLSYATIANSVALEEGVLAEGSTLLSKTFNSRLVIFRTVVYRGDGGNVSLGDFTGDDEHVIFVNGIEVFRKMSYTTTPDVNIYVPQGISYIDIMCNDGTGNGGFRYTQTLSSQVSYMYAAFSGIEEKRGNASAIQIVKADINYVNDRVSSQASSITTLNSRVDSIGNVGGNLLRNTSFKQGVSYWGINAHAVSATWETRNPPDEWALQDNDLVTGSVHYAGKSRDDAYGEFVQKVAVREAENYQMSVYVGNHRCAAVLFAYFYGVDGSEIGNSHTIAMNNPSSVVYESNGRMGGRYETQYTRLVHNFTTPVGCTSVSLVLRGFQLVTDPYLFFVKPMLCTVANPASPPAAWGESSKMEVSLADTNQVVDGVRGVSTVSIDNNGWVSGYGLISNLVNGKVTSEFAVNADLFVVGNSNVGKKKPFIVTSSNQVVNGVNYPPGVWMDVATIADATIGNAKIANLDAGKINVGTLSADRIASKSISADKLVVGSGANMYGDQYNLRGTQGWGGAVTSAYDVVVTGNALTLSGRDHIGPGDLDIPIRVGETYVIEVVATRTKGNLSLNAGFWYYKTDKQATPTPFHSVGSLTSIVVYGGWTKYTYHITVSEGGGDIYNRPAYGRLYFQIDQAASGGSTAWRVGDIKVMRAVENALVVNGGITADKLSVNSVTADKINVANLSLISGNLGTISVGTANIAQGAITTAKIGDLQVDTIKIKDNAVTSLIDIRRAAANTVVDFPAHSAGSKQTVRVKVVLASGLNTKNRYLVHWRGAFSLSISSAIGYGGGSDLYIYFGSSSSTTVAGSSQIAWGHTNLANTPTYSHERAYVGTNDQWSIAEAIVDNAGQLCIWGVAEWTLMNQNALAGAVKATLYNTDLTILMTEYKK